ncbi:MAG: glycosyltransferase family 2 protein [Anaerolineales bacterium]
MKISVTIPSYNQADFLAEAIDSVLDQTLPADEIIIVDDASTDNSRVIAAAYQARFPECVKVILHPQNLGVAAARNTALQAARGDYLTYLDADDRYLPDKLAQEAARLQAADQPDLVYSDYYVINSQGERIDRWADGQALPEGDVFTQTFGRQFPQRRLFRCELVNAAAWRQVGDYRGELAVYEDYEMRIRLTKWLRVGAVAQPLSEHRRHAYGLSRRPALAFLAAFEKILAVDSGLLNDLPEDQQHAVQRQLDAWHAELLRRHSLEIAHHPGPWTRRMQDAWQVFRQSRRYDPRLYWWYFLQLWLPKDATRILRAWRGRMRQKRLGR